MKPPFSPFIFLLSLNVGLGFWAWSVHTKVAYFRLKVKALESAIPIADAKDERASSRGRERPSAQEQGVEVKAESMTNPPSAIAGERELFASQVVRSQIRESEKYVEQTFGEAVLSLGLDPNTVRRVKSLLAEQRNVALKVSGREGKTANQAAAEIDSEIREAIGPAQYAKLQEMLELSSELNDVRIHYVAELSIGATPLQGDQAVALAQAVKSQFSGPMEGLASPAEAISYRVQGIDKTTGLSDADRRFLQQVSPQLSKLQQTNLQKKLVQMTARFVEASERRGESND